MKQEYKKLFIKTYGCQMNVYDTKRMSDLLEPLGYQSTEEADNADLAILNTCHIREKATDKVFSDLGRLNIIRKKRTQNGQDLMIGVAGCVAQAEGDYIFKRAPFVDMVFGPQSYHKLPEMIAQIARKKSTKEKGKGILNVDFPVEEKFDLLPEITSKQGVSTFLSIQEGCDKFCSFCVVPYTRGAEFSRPVDDVYKEAKRLVSLGSKEIVLLGQNVNAYHGLSRDKKNWNLAQLINHISDIDGVERIRYTTSHPRDMNKDLLECHRDNEKLMPFLHLPVQSGSDKILKAMNRKHTAQHYIDIIEELRSHRPDIALSSDFIVGFPGETEEDFKETLALVEKVYYAQAFSFKYSPRPGTPGALLNRHLDEKVKLERLYVLQDLLKAQQKQFNDRSVGQVEKVLIEKIDTTKNKSFGRTAFMQNVTIDALLIPGQTYSIKLTESFQNSLIGHEHSLHQPQKDEHFEQKEQIAC